MLMAINKTSQRTLSESANDKIYQSARVRSSRGTDGVRTSLMRNGGAGVLEDITYV